MSEIVEDLKIANLEITNNIGLVFSAENSNIYHDNTGEFDISSNGKIEIKTVYDGDDHDPDLGLIFIKATAANDEAIRVIGEKGWVEIKVKNEIHGFITNVAHANDTEAIQLIAPNGGVSIRAEGSTNGTIYIWANSNSDPAIDIEAENGDIKIKTQSSGDDILLVTQENDSVIIPHTLKAGTVYQSYDPQSEPTGPYALLVPTGAIMPYAGELCPAGWLFCDGAGYNSATYPTLRSVIGTRYGTGDGEVTDFNVPNLCGRVPLGAGSNEGLTTRTLGTPGGQEAITKVPPHTHSIEVKNTGINYDVPSTAIDNFDYIVPKSLDYGNGTQISTNNSGTNIQLPSVDVMNPFLVLNYIIKV